MKIQIDFDKKVIKLESNVNIKDFFDIIKLEDWKDYTLETNTVINWNMYPYYVYPYLQKPYEINCTSSTTPSTTLTNSNINKGISNVTKYTSF